MSSPRSILLLGSTGTIGVNTLDVIRRHPDRFTVYGLVAGRNVQRLFQQAMDHRPHVLVICDADALAHWHQSGLDEELSAKLGYSPQVGGLNTLDALCASSEVDTVVAAIVGAAGLKPTLSALKAGKRVLLANKESLVLAGRFMIEAAQQSGAVLLPVDSEHNAIFQCLPADFDVRHATSYGIERLVLTASGGPFRSKSLDEIQHVTPAQAVAHPNWVMGPKISVDSATMANKGLELIEALWMFGLPPAQLSVLIHPQSIVHSLVEYKDGSMLAQLGCPDMRTPIAHVLGLPDRISSGSARLNLANIARLEFEEPDLQRFPMLGLAFDALNKADSAAPVFNAANEVSVECFLKGIIQYPDIVRITAQCLERFGSVNIQSLDDALDLDAQVRVHARSLIHPSTV
ncbi:1-deoxy-D-xylulose-5-phosphate reductoisomerase [Limnobacter humi]|uniref:1-deoxy-D-xylulose 5-phosphate reductoisomerase n=1 Tax=Limnobacter humi TaxID=1778671 RepID=A0ABT1WEW7_9BURK|nr:1-deoxy-D-xylulose-5-phosphate reductoisomerase [Limnobacter humi]MCQ8896030.1 1-deoxy-D-xylulose-5-phosphate reductoisomerase [Limnobacter humi]